MGPRCHISPEEYNDCPASPTSANPRRHDGHRMSLSGTPQALTPAVHHRRHHHPGHRQTYSMDDKSLDSCMHSERTRSQRSHSVQARHRGDQGAGPLETLKREAIRAHRSPHLQRTQLPGPDTIDWLDRSGTLYHHEGPYDATLLARNISLANSPVAAVKESNEEALKATPKEKIKDALERHRPLDGVADVRSGTVDFLGRRLEYEEGPNLMIEGGKYKRWSGVVCIQHGTGDFAFPWLD
jgi:Pal1 cell morphology protein